MRTLRVALVVVAVTLWTAGTSRAQDSGPSDIERAESLAAAGFEAYGRKDYAAAVALYKQALDAAPSADIVYNLARIHDTKLKDRKLAIEYYRRYTLDTAADPNRLRTASLRLAELAELETIAAETPERRETATELRAPDPAEAPQPSAADDSGLSGLQIAGIATGAAGIVGIGIGAGFGFAAKSDADVAHEFCNGNACRTQRGVDAAEDARKAATISTVAFVAGGALAALGLTFVIAGGGDDAERELSGVSLSPFGGPAAVGSTLTARF